MPFTDMSRLKRLLATYADRSKNDRKRRRAGKELQQRFPPKRRTSLYAKVLREKDLSEQARWMTMLILYHVGNEPAVRGIKDFLYDPIMPTAQKFNAAMLLFSLNPRMKLEPSKHLPKYPLVWLRQAINQMPHFPEEIRRQFVLQELLFDFFDEGEE